MPALAAPSIAVPAMFQSLPLTGLGGHINRKLANWPDEAGQLARRRSAPEADPSGSKDAGIGSAIDAELSTRDRQFGRDACLALPHRSREWSMPGVVSGLAENVAQQGVAGLGNGSTVHGGSAGMFAGDKPGIRHEFSGVFEATEIPRLGDNRHRAQEGNPPQALQRRNQRQVRALLRGTSQFGLEPADAQSCLVQGAAVIAEDGFLIRRAKSELIDPSLDFSDPVLTPAGGAMPLRSKNLLRRPTTHLFHHQ
jgi:hypothetical protein